MYLHQTATSQGLVCYDANHYHFKCCSEPPNVPAEYLQLGFGQLWHLSGYCGTYWHIPILMHGEWKQYFLSSAAFGSHSAHSSSICFLVTQFVCWAIANDSAASLYTSVEHTQLLVESDMRLCVAMALLSES